LIGGNSKQQSVEQLALASWLGVSGVYSVGKVMKTVESSLKPKFRNWAAKLGQQKGRCDMT
jgi:hypothetical protein